MPKSGAALPMGTVLAMVLLVVLRYMPANRKRKRELADCSWFEQLLRDQDGSHLLNQANTRRKDYWRDAEDTVGVSMLLDLAPGTECRGPLTDWSREERLLWRYHGSPTDAWTWKVRHAAKFNPELRVPAGQ